MAFVFIYRKLRYYQTHVNVIRIRNTPFGAGKSSISAEIDAYNAINRRVASSYKIAYIDITPISRSGLKDPSMVAGDGLHPSGAQYGKWVEEILVQLNLK